MDSKSEDEISKGTNKIFEDLDEDALQNHATEVRLRMKLEREDLKCTYLKFEIENANRECLMATESTEDLRKTVVETQAEMNQISEEVVKQREAIEDICSDDRLKNFSNVVELISQAVGEYRKHRLTLEAEVEKCKHYSSKIERTIQDITKLSNLVNFLKVERENIIDDIQSKTIKLKRFLDNVSDARVKQLHAEFAKCMALKHELSKLEVRKLNLEETWKQSKENHKIIQDELRDLSSRYEDLNTRHSAELNNIRGENQEVLNDFRRMKNPSFSSEEYDQICLLLKNLKSELNNFKRLNETLRFRRSELESDIALLYRQIGLKEQEIKIEQDKKVLWEKERRGDEETLLSQQNRLKVIEENISEVRSRSKALDDEISHLRTEYESLVSHGTDGGGIDVATNWDELQKELENSNRKLASLAIEENHMRRVVEKLEVLETQSVSQLDTIMAFVNKLEAINLEAKKNLTQKIDEENQQINCHLEDISAFATDKYEKELFLDALRNDLRFQKEVYEKKQFEVWSLTQENARRSTDYDELTMKLSLEQSNLDRLRSLVHDLEKNTVPNEKIPDTWFQSFELEKKKFKTLHKERLQLEKEKASIREKLERYQYAEYKIRRVSQSMSKLNLRETDTKKKTNKELMRKKN